MPPARSIAATTEQRTFQSRPGIIETVMPERITAAALELTFDNVARLGSGPLWLVDCTLTVGFETACIAPAAKRFPTMKKDGLRRLVTITPSPAIRMATRAATLASGIEVRVVEQRLEAAKFLDLTS